MLLQAKWLGKAQNYVIQVQEKIRMFGYWEVLKGIKCKIWREVMKGHIEVNGDFNRTWHFRTSNEEIYAKRLS